MKKNRCFLLLCLLTLLLTSCGSKDTTYKTLEDEVVGRSLILQETYGKISNDMATAYCDGEKTYLILYYYGIGKESQNLGSTYCMYVTDKDGETEISDPNGDYDDLTVEFMNVMRLQYEAKWEEYKYKDMEITYEQYKNFEEGYLPTCYASNDKLRETD